MDELFCLFGHPSFEYLGWVLVGDIMLGALCRRLGVPPRLHNGALGPGIDDFGFPL